MLVVTKRKAYEIFVNRVLSVFFVDALVEPVSSHRDGVIVKSFNNAIVFQAFDLIELDKRTKNYIKLKTLQFFRCVLSLWHQ